MTLTKKQIQRFLEKVDKSFPVPISEKQNLSEYATKLLSQATLCCEIENDEIVSMVAGYTDNLTDALGYVSLVATIEGAQGNGYAKKLIMDFLGICGEKNINAVHLYTHITNEKAIRMYKDLGFEDYVLKNEPRPDDVHLIYRKRGRNV